MDIQTHGIILNTQNYQQCVRFYQQLFKLKILFQKEEADFQLCCFEFGGSYLMVETGGTAKPEGRSIVEGAMKLRFNVSDIEQALIEVRSYGIDANIDRADWGSTINIFDPDGNRIGIRDEGGYRRQLGNS